MRAWTDCGPFIGRSYGKGKGVERSGWWLGPADSLDLFND